MTVIQDSITHLERRVARLEETLQKLLRKRSEELNKVAALQPAQLPQTQLLDWLKDQGVIRLPTAEEEQLANEWNELPENVKQEHKNFMQHLALDPPLSQIILENRR